MAQLRDHDAIQAKRDFFMVDPRKLITRKREPQPDLQQQGNAEIAGFWSLLDALKPHIAQLTDIANAAFDAGDPAASVPFELIQQIDTIYRQARGE